jgi:hypothetical protein
MAAIYRNAFVVIGADMSKDCHGGFLDAWKSNEYPLGPGTAIAHLEDQDSTIYYSKIEGECLTGTHYNPCILWSTDGQTYVLPGKNKQKLAERAWTFQEHLLVTRMIHFADTEIIWECTESLRCECMALDYERPEDHKASYQQALISQNSVKFDLWSSIVDAVTQRKITYDTDVLPALSGIANEMQAAGAGPYLAGVSLEDFPLCLLWDTQPWRSWYSYGTLYSSVYQRHVSPFIAPSWSWASLKNVEYVGN